MTFFFPDKYSMETGNIKPSSPHPTRNRRGRPAVYISTMDQAIAVESIRTNAAAASTPESRAFTNPEPEITPSA